MTPGPHPSDLRHFDDAVRNVRRRRALAFEQMHPDLAARCRRIEAMTDGRLSPWTACRGEEEQNAAWLNKKSQARFGSSPHNYEPALAVDWVLNPEKVRVRERPDAPGWPDLWDPETAEAQQAWQDLHNKALSCGLLRVWLDVGGHRWLDRPHTELPGWRTKVEAGEVAPVR